MKENTTIKWLFSGGLYQQHSGDLEIVTTPGKGVYTLLEDPNPMSKVVLMKPLFPKFQFDYKLYDLEMDKYLEYIQKTWEDDLFVDSNKNLGVIFNGIKGTGKTVAAKLLCNKLDLTVICVPAAFDGLELFLSQIPFDCVIFIDEMEKIFKKDENDSVLLRVIDGIYSGGRKLFIMTTNTLNINNNLVGRPGRIRYIKSFDNLPIKIVKAYLEDNLNDKSKVNDLINFVDTLEISTIDILKCLVEEMNIHGKIEDDFAKIINVERAASVFDVVTCYDANSVGGSFDKFKELVPKEINSVKEWTEYVKQDSTYKGDSDEKYWSREDWLNEFYDVSSCRMSSSFQSLFLNCRTSLGKVVREPDDDGYFISEEYNNTRYCKLIGERKMASLYRNQIL